MSLNEIEIRVLRNIDQNVILAPAPTEGDVVDPSTGKTAAPRETMHKLLEEGYVAWTWDAAHEANTLTLTSKGRAALAP